MKTNNQLAFALFATAALAMGACGKKEKDGSATSTKPMITGTTQADGRATLNFTSPDGSSANFQCRVVQANTVGEWTPCPTGTFSYPIQENQSVYLQVRNGENGEIANQMFTGMAAPAPAAEPILGSNLNLSNMILAGNHVFRVPEDMQLVRYSTSNTGRFQQALSIMGPERTMLADWVPQTLCEKFQGQMMPSVSLEFEILPNVISSMSGITANYCAYRARNEQAFKEIEQLEMGTNQIEVASAPSANIPFQYISAALFTSQQDASSTKRLFDRLCSGDLVVHRAQPFHNIPVKASNLGMAGYASQATVYTCQTDVTVGWGSMNQRVDVVHYRIARQRNAPSPCNNPIRPNGLNCPKIEQIEYTYIIEANSRTSYETVAHLVNRSLNTLSFYIR